MIRGHMISKAAILLARRIAGPGRDEWVHAMAAEWDALEAGRTAWALGCLGAALRDRLGRERRFVSVMLVSVPAAMIWSAMAMTLVAPPLRQAGAPTIAWMAAYLLNPLIVQLVLGALYPARAGTIGLFAGGAFLVAPMLASAILFDVSPLAWMSLVGHNLGGSAAAYPLALAAWYLASRAGARISRNWRRFA